MYLIMLDKACQRFGAGIRMATGGIVHRGLRYELMPVSMLISAAVPFCLLLKGVELLILRPTRHTSAHVNFCRGSVLSTAERSRVTYFTTDKAHERAAVSQGGVGKRWKNHGVFLRYSYSSGLILTLLASDTPVLA